MYRDSVTCFLTFDLRGASSSPAGSFRLVGTMGRLGSIIFCDLSNKKMVRKAIAVFQGKLEGYVEFIENKKTLTIKTHVRGLSKGKHGFHIHESGNLLGEGCMKACAHFNPDNKNHGGSRGSDRHAGDLGNITSRGKQFWCTKAFTRV